MKNFDSNKTSIKLAANDAIEFKIQDKTYYLPTRPSGDKGKLQFSILYSETVTKID